MERARLEFAEATLEEALHTSVGSGRQHGRAATNRTGLTRRQVEVVRLLGEGLTNAQIAERLVLSKRTVEGHVAAALDKLHAPTRRQAIDRAAELGLLGDET